MMTFRHAVVATTALLATGLSVAASAQADPQTVVNDIIACSSISTVEARVACYDAVATTVRSAAGTATPHAQASAPAAPVLTPRESFGRESMPEREDRPQVQELPEITAAVTGTRQVRPGYYTIALDDGSEWEFTESVPSSYFPPRRGARITVQRGALGSFQLVVRGQAPRRVRRVR
jgi:hypothetical protein